MAFNENADLENYISNELNDTNTVFLGIEFHNFDGVIDSNLNYTIRPTSVPRSETLKVEKIRGRKG